MLLKQNKKLRPLGQQVKFSWVIPPTPLHTNISIIVVRTKCSMFLNNIFFLEKLQIPLDQFVYSHPGLGINTIYQLCLCTVIQACISTIYHLAPEDCTVSVTFKSKLFPVLNMYIYPEYKRSCWVLIKYLIKTH